MASAEQTIKIDNSRSRFSAFPWSKVKPDIFIIGVGGTGSFTAMNLSRIGYPIHIWDFDSFDETNIAGQLCRCSSTGKLKVDEIKEVCELFSKDTNIHTNNQVYGINSMTNPIIISCVDSMRGRKTIFEKWVSALPSFKEQNALFIDTRMLATQYEIYIVPNSTKHIEKYRTFLFEDSEIPEADCNSKATTFCGSLVGARVTNIITNFLSNKYHGDDDMCYLPFKISEELSQLKINIYDVR